MIVVINWRDNPWFGKEGEALRKWDYENLSRAKYNWIWEGKYNDAVDDSIIQPEWVDAAVDAHLKIKGMDRGVKAMTDVLTWSMTRLVLVLALRWD